MNLYQMMNANGGQIGLGGSSVIQSQPRSFYEPPYGPEEDEDDPSTGRIFGLGDTLMAPIRGVAGFGSAVTNLAMMPFGSRVSDRFGMSGSSTMIGGGVEALTQFATGFIPGLGIAGALGRVGGIAKGASALQRKVDAATKASMQATAAGRFGSATKAAKAAAKWKGVQDAVRFGTAGAFADFVGFEGHEANLANLLKEHAGLNDPITDFLATDEDGGEIDNRLRNAILGGGLGLIGDGLFTAFRIFRAGSRARNQGLDPTPSMLQESQRIRREQTDEIRGAFNATEDEAAGTNAIIDALGVDRSLLRGFRGGRAAQEELGAAGVASDVVPDAFARFHADSTVTIGALRGADFSSAVHEIGHVARRFLVDTSLPQSVRYGMDDASINRLSEWAGASWDEASRSWQWSRDAEERFTDGLTAYLMARRGDPRFAEAGMPSELLAVGDYLETIYRTARELPEMQMSREVADGFEQMLSRGRLLREGVRELNIPRVDPARRAVMMAEREVLEGINRSTENVLFSMDSKPWKLRSDTFNAGGTTRYTAEIPGVDGDLEVFFDRASAMGGVPRTDRVDPRVFVQFMINEPGRAGAPVSDSPKQALQILRTVAEAVKKYVETNDRPILAFTPDTPTKGAIYAKIIDRLAASVGYTKRVGKSRDGETVLVPREKAASIPKDLLFQARVGRFPGDPEGIPGTVPGSAGLGNPGARGREPYAPINFNRASTIEEVNKNLRDLVVSKRLAAAADNRTYAEVISQMRDDVDYLHAVAGTKHHAQMVDEIIASGRASEAQLIAHGNEIQGMRQLVAEMTLRVTNIAKKGAAASESEMYEFLRGVNLADAYSQRIRLQVGQIARILNRQAIVPEPREISLLPSVDFSDVPRMPSESGMRAEGASATELAPLTGLTPAREAPTEPRPVRTRSRPSGERAGDVIPDELLPQPGAARPDERPALDPAISDAVIKNAIEEAGGVDNVRRQMKKYWMAASTGGDAGVGKLIRGSDSIWNRSKNSIIEYWMNAILSGPITHAVNVTSTAMATLYLPMERALGATLRLNFAQAAEALQGYAHLMTSLPDATRFALIAAKQGDNILEKSFSKVREAGMDPNRRAISAQNWGVDGDSIGGAAIDWLGKFVNLPSRMLMFEDEFFKQLNYRAYLKTSIQRIGYERFGGDTAAAGRWANEAFERATKDGQGYAEQQILRRAYAAADDAVAEGLLKNNWRARSEFVTKYMGDTSNWDTELGAAAKNALEQARVTTFQTPLDPTSDRFTVSVGGRIQNMVSAWPTLRFLMPFVRTPTNLLTFALDRIPLVGQYGNMQATQDMFRGMARQLASPEEAVRADSVGRLAVGISASYAFLSAAQSGVITGGGPFNREEKELRMSTGWRPYSIKVGDAYYSYRRADPFATLLGTMADLVENFSVAGEMEEVGEMFDVAVNAIVASIASNITNKTYLVGVTNLANALSEPARFGRSLVNQYAGSFVPSIVNQSHGVFDDDVVVREARTIAEAMRARIPGMSDALPPRRNLFGEPITKNRRTIGVDMPFSPVEYSEVDNDLVWNELAELGHGFLQRPVPRRGGLDLTKYTTNTGQQAYDRWLELHGEVKIGGLTLRDRLSRVIRSQAYQSQASAADVHEYESPRIRVLREIISRYRSAAWEQTLRESRELMDDYNIDQQNRLDLRRGRITQSDQLRALSRR